MTNLLDNIGNGFQRRNFLHNRNIVTVYVENEDDVPFWKHIFDQFEIPTTITPSTHERDEEGGLTRGKQNVLRFANQAHKDFVLCVDSDYDYLLDGATELSRKIKENPFVFQTYTYSIENYKCFAEGLHQVVVEATLNDQQVFDFVGFMERYSEMVYELFLYSFYYEKQHLVGEAWEDASSSPRHFFTIGDFCGTIGISDKIDIFSNAGEQELVKLRQVVTEKLASLPKIDDATLETLKGELTELGLKPNNTYLFVQGHTILDDVVWKFLVEVFNDLIKQKIEEFKNLAKTEKTKAERIENYQKHVFVYSTEFPKTEEDSERKPNKHKEPAKRMTSLKRILFSHKNYQSCPLMQKIRDDVEKYKIQWLSTVTAS